MVRNKKARKKRRPTGVLPPAPSGTHPLVAQGLATTLADLRVGGTLTDGWDWWPVHFTQATTWFEFTRGRERSRGRYNKLCIARARKEQKPVLAEHNGFFDYFVPIGKAGGLGVLVVGPFARARPTRADLFDQWRAVTGTHAQASDPDLFRFANSVLDTLTLSEEGTKAFGRLLAAFALALSGEGELMSLASEIEHLQQELAPVRLTDRVWTAVNELTDDDMWQTWLSPYLEVRRRSLGLKRIPTDVVVGHLIAREANADPIESLLRRDALLRRSAEHFSRAGGILSGRLGDHSVILHVENGGSRAQRQARLVAVTEELVGLARKLQLRVCAGLALRGEHVSVPECYRSALAAAEEALVQGAAQVWATSARPQQSSRVRRESLGRLAQAVRQQPSVLRLRFDRFIEASAPRSGYRLETFRNELQSAFDQVLDGLEARGAVDERSVTELLTVLEQRAQAPTIREVSAAYRDAVSALEAALSRPAAATRERGIQRALDYVCEHLAEPLRLAQVARLAGFAPSHFSVLFTRSQHKSFRSFLVELRVERAKQMLTDTDLSVERVAGLSGFPTRSRLYQAFHAHVGKTPAEYRRAG